MPEPDPVALARLWAALAGGNLPDARARDLARRIEERWPGTAHRVRRARGFHITVARQAAEAGARGIIFGGAGLPVARPFMHSQVLDASPAVRVLYADPGDEAVFMREGTTAGEPRVSVTRARIRDPGAILSAAAEAGLRAPLHVQFLTALTWIPDDVARQAIADWARLLSRGDSLALSVVVRDEGDDAAESTEFSREFLAGAGAIHPRTAATVRAWLTDAGLDVDEPGVVPAETWPLRPVIRRPGREMPRLAVAVARAL